MILNQKTFRYYYWIIQAFVTKHLRLILLSFFVSIVGIISLISLSPYLISLTSTKRDVIGIVGNHGQDTLPDTVLSQVSNGLVFINEKGETIPVIASRWEQSKDGKIYKYFLKKNLFWNDNKPFTAQGINYKFKDVEVKVKNDYEVEFHLKKPLPIFPTYLTAPIIRYPFVGVAGLYKVDRYKMLYGNVKELYLSPNKPGLSLMVYKFYDNETKMVDAYKLGEINQMSVTKKSVADIFKTWKNTTIEKSIDYSRLLTLFFNMKSDALKQKDVRKAVVNAIERDDFKEEGIEAFGPIPPISWAYNPNLKKTVHDPERAQKVLKKSEASESASLQLYTYYDYLDKAESIKKSLDEVGLGVKINTVTFNQPEKFDMLLAFWKVPLDPDQYYFWHSTQKQGNIINYNNIKIDKLLEDGRTTTSVDERKRIYFDFQRNLIDDLPAFFIYYPYTYTVRRK